MVQGHSLGVELAYRQAKAVQCLRSFLGSLVWLSLGMKESAERQVSKVGGIARK